jgi:hypothetical protein
MHFCTFGHFKLLLYVFLTSSDNISEYKNDATNNVNNLLSFRPNLVQKNENYVDSEEETSGGDDSSTTPPLETTTAHLHNNNNNDEEDNSIENTDEKQTQPSRPILRRVNKTAEASITTTTLTASGDYQLSTIYLISTKVLTYLILVFVILFIVNLVFRFNKYWFQGKYKERIDGSSTGVIGGHASTTKTTRSSKPASSDSPANSTYFNPTTAAATATVATSHNDEAVYDIEHQSSSDDEGNENVGDGGEEDEDDSDEEMNFFYAVSSARLHANTSKSPSTSDHMLMVKSHSNSKCGGTTLATAVASHEDNLNHIGSGKKYSYSYSKNNAEQQSAVLEGDKRSEHSITDRNKMKYVEEWLNSISLVKYFIVNTSPSMSNYDTYYYHGPSPTLHNTTTAGSSNARRSHKHYRSVNL